MCKNLFTLIAVFSAILFAACQPNPTPIHSTRHQVEKPKAADGNHSSAGHSPMNHSAMQSAPNAAAQPYDLQFLDTMTAHHERAIEMAKAAVTDSQTPEIITFASKIVADQTREISEMKRWRDGWFAGKPSALNMEMSGMADSTKRMEAAKLKAASGDAYSLTFLNQMIPHHEGAIMMAREALTRAEHAEIKTLANQIIGAQEAEIRQMQTWKTQWAK